MANEVTIEKSTKANDKYREPKRYKVVFFNDNVTPMEFVIALLMKVFKHSQEISYDITMKVHNEGSAVAGVYPHEIADQKASEGTTLAQANRYPLKIKIEQE